MTSILLNTPARRLSDQALARAQLRELLERKLDALPEAFRVVFVLRSVEDMSGWRRRWRGFETKVKDEVCTAAGHPS